MRTAKQSLVDYYRGKRFNPVFIQVEDAAIWKDHIAKRRNLYTRHLGMPMSLMRDARILEFGANSGENGLVAAMHGARLTLVEPNEQVHPRIEELFGRFNLTPQIEAISKLGIEEYPSTEPFDIVLAEGFLYTLPNRDAMLRKIQRLIVPGGIGVISYNDRAGGLLEGIRKAYLLRACQLAGVDPRQGDADVAPLARQLFFEEYSKLKASRSLDAWWRDTLVNPLLNRATLWSFPEVLDILEAEGSEVLGTSPRWSDVDTHAWYKNVPTVEQRHRKMLDDWRGRMIFFITGRTDDLACGDRIDLAGITLIENLVNRLNDQVLHPEMSFADIEYLEPLRRLLAGSPSAEVRRLEAELQSLFANLHAASVDDLVRAYHSATLFRASWGAPYHYVSFQRV